MSQAPLRLLLVRHGQATANVELRYLGSRDDPLTSHGMWQAARLAEALRPLPIAAIYSSPLRRATETAGAIAAVWGRAVSVDERLREGSFGDWEGLSRAEVLARSQQEGVLLARWEADPSAAPPNGESLESVQARTLALVHDLAELHGGAWIVLVSHVGPIKALLCAALHAPLTTARRLFLDPATISVVDWSAFPVVRLFNAHAHLGWEAARWMEGGS